MGMEALAPSLRLELARLNGFEDITKRKLSYIVYTLLTGFGQKDRE